MTKWNAWSQGDFFVLLQSEEGDLFKVTIDRDNEDVEAIKIKYFDTVPIASALCILKTGFLFVAAETGNQWAFHSFNAMESLTMFIVNYINSIN